MPSGRVNATMLLMVTFNRNYLTGLQALALYQSPMLASCKRYSFFGALPFWLVADTFLFSPCFQDKLHAFDRAAWVESISA